MQEQFDFFENLNEFLAKNLKLLLAAACLSITIAGAYGLFAYNRSLAGAKAYKAFVHLKKIIDAPIHQNKDQNSTEHEDELCFATEDEKWYEVEIASAQAYESHGSNKLGAHLALFKTQALLKQNKPAAALEFLNSCIPNLPNSPVKEMALAEQALMQLDSVDETSQKQGLATLKNIAHSKSAAADFAYYWLGEYHWIKGNTEEAKITWNALVSEHSKSSMQMMDEDAGDADLFKSPWVAKAKKSLNLIQ